jgi:hypothetical protein
MSKPRTIEEVRAHAAAWMAKQDPVKNLPMRDVENNAVPELLDALRELVAKYDAQGHDSPELGKARAAIDKADGQQ